jgi:hypothetical protein
VRDVEEGIEDISPCTIVTSGGRETSGHERDSIDNGAATLRLEMI